MAQELEGCSSYNLSQHHFQQHSNAAAISNTLQSHQFTHSNPKWMSHVQIPKFPKHSRPSSSVLRPSLKQHRCNCQAPVIGLKRCFEVLKAFRSFLLDTLFTFSIHCAAAQNSPVNSLITPQHNQGINHQIILGVFLLSHYF